MSAAPAEPLGPLLFDWATGFAEALEQHRATDAAELSKVLRIDPKRFGGDVVQARLDTLHSTETRRRREAERTRDRDERLLSMRATNPNGASCSTHDNPEWFTDPQNKGEFTRAVSVCMSTCPRRTQCLTDALESGEEWGVRGGVWFVDGKPKKRFFAPHE